jgi:integrase
MATIRKRGAKWQVQIRRVGFRSISRSFHIRKDAEAWARQLEVQADRCELPSDRTALQRVTLGELVERYRDTISVKKRGYAVERIVLTAFLRHPICRKRLSQIRIDDFAAYRDERLKSVKATTLKREFSPLHNLFEVARNEWGLPLDNPLDRIRLRLPPQRRERRLKDGELDRLLVATQSCRNCFVRPIILFAIATGMRRSEILSLRWEDIHREASSLLIRHTKNGYSRTVPLTKAMVAILDRLPTSDERIFPISANAFRLAWGSGQSTR